MFRKLVQKWLKMSLIALVLLFVVAPVAHAQGDPVPVDPDAAVNIELIIALATGLLASIIVGVVAYLTSKNPQDALLEALKRLAKQEAMLDQLESAFLGLPEATRNLLRAGIAQAVEVAKTTETPLDDALVDVFSKITDGQPNHEVWRLN